MHELKRRVCTQHVFLLHVVLPFFLSNSISRSIQSENEGEGYHDCAVGGLVDILLLILLSA